MALFDPIREDPQPLQRLNTPEEIAFRRNIMRGLDPRELINLLVGQYQGELPGITPLQEDILAELEAFAAAPGIGETAEERKVLETLMPIARGERRISGELIDAAERGAGFQRQNVLNQLKNVVPTSQLGTPQFATEYLRGIAPIEAQLEGIRARELGLDLEREVQASNLIENILGSRRGRQMGEFQTSLALADIPRQIGTQQEMFAHDIFRGQQAGAQTLLGLGTDVSEPIFFQPGAPSYRKRPETAAFETWLDAATTVAAAAVQAHNKEK